MHSGIFRGAIKVTQKKKETSCKYIVRFTGSIIWGTNDGLKWWIFKNELRSNCMFQEMLGLEGACSLNDFLSKA